MAQPDVSQTQLYEWLTGDDDSRMCDDIPDDACQEQPHNFFLHLFASLGNKLADELSSARLVLPWLLGIIGAPVWMVGLLVPIREAGALLPPAVCGWLYSPKTPAQVGVGGGGRAAGGGGSRFGVIGPDGQRGYRRLVGVGRVGHALLGTGALLHCHQGRARQNHRQAPPRHFDGLERQRRGWCNAGCRRCIDVVR